MQFLASKCYYHPERGAVATCAKCGAGICRDCAVKHDGGVILCYQCENEYLRKEHREYRKQLKERGGSFTKGTDFIIPSIVGLLLIAVFGALEYFGVTNNPPNGAGGYLLEAYLLFSIPFSYTLISDLFAPKYDVYGWWIIKLMIKITLSALSAPIILPILLVRFIVKKFASGKNKT